MNIRVGGVEASPGSLHNTSEIGQGTLNQDISLGTVTEEPQFNSQQEIHNVVSCLNFYSLAVTLRTTGLNIKKIYVLPTLRLCVLYGSQNKQQLLPYKTLRDWFL
jgi:hypothetical protein